LGNKLITEAAKELRQKQTEAEKILWFKLRDKQMDRVKFRRQEPIGNYIVDFVNFEKKLVIEIDGSPHRETIVKINDKQRTSWLKSEGSRIIRFWNADILNDIEGVMEKIKGNLT
jgi:5-methyltetrahydrofolate--homocysteine methyltransferase